jgi:hypothetical protein
MATKTKAKRAPRKKTVEVVSPGEQYKRDMLARRNALRKLQGIPEHK